MKILIIDDSRMMRMIISDIVASLGYETLEAGSGEKAFEQLEKHCSDIVLVLLDWNMPEMNGLDFLQKMKENTEYNKIPVMMVTTEGERINVIKAMKHGAINYLAKPFTPEDLAAKVLECLGVGNGLEEL